MVSCDGRQAGSQALAENFGYVARMNYELMRCQGYCWGIRVCWQFRTRSGI